MRAVASNPVRSEQLRRFLVGVAVGFVLVRLLGPAWRTGFAPSFPDSSSYQAVAERGPFSLTFWFDERPPTYPLLIWVCGRGARAVIVAQTLLAVLAWGWLCSTIWRGISRRPLALAAICHTPPDRRPDTLAVLGHSTVDRVTVRNAGGGRHRHTGGGGSMNPNGGGSSQRQRSPAHGCCSATRTRSRCSS